MAPQLGRRRGSAFQHLSNRSTRSADKFGKGSLSLLTSGGRRPP